MTARLEPYTAEELRIWRAKERLSQADVAALFGTSQRSVSNWELGCIPRGFSEAFERVLIAYYHVPMAHDLKFKVEEVK